MECLYEKNRNIFKKDFLKRLNIKKRKIVKEVDQKSTKMNL
jgi:hypothetical protein